jgi:hypothetical protein
MLLQGKGKGKGKGEANAQAHPFGGKGDKGFSPSASAAYGPPHAFFNSLMNQRNFPPMLPPVGYEPATSMTMTSNATEKSNSYERGRIDDKHGWVDSNITSQSSFFGTIAIKMCIYDFS